MPVQFASLRRHRWLASLLVVAFALRALVPAGFMPGGDGRFGLQICPDGFPAALLASSGAAHAGHGHGGSHHEGDSYGVADHAAMGHVTPASGSGEPPSHHHKSWMSGQCAFAAVAFAPPASHSPTFAPIAESLAPRDFTETARLAPDLRFRIAQPRAPPLA